MKEILNDDIREVIKDIIEEVDGSYSSAAVANKLGMQYANVNNRLAKSTTNSVNIDVPFLDKFCVKYNTSMDSVMERAYQKAKLSDRPKLIPKEQYVDEQTAVKSFFDVFFKDSRFVYDFNSDTNMKSFVPNSAYHVIHLPLTEHDSISTRGEIEFKIDDNTGFCSVKLSLEDIDRQKIEHQGWGLVVKTKGGIDGSDIFWGLMRQSDSANILTICFRVSKNVAEWNTRIVQVLSINNKEQPTLYRFLLTKDVLSDQEFTEFFENLIMLNIVNIPVEKSHYEAIENYANGKNENIPEEYLLKLKSHFKDVKIDKIKLALDRYYNKAGREKEIFNLPIIEIPIPVDRPREFAEDILEYVLLRTWLRKGDMSTRRNVAEKTDDRNAEVMDKYVKNRRRS